MSILPIHLVINGPTYTGREFAPDTQILMIDGTTKKTRDIVAGDRVMGEDARPKTVTRVSSGINDMYEVTPVRGEKYVVSGDHVLVLKATNMERTNYDKTKHRVMACWLQNFANRSKQFLCSQYGSKEETEAIAKKFLVTIARKFEGYHRYGDIVEIKVSDYLRLPYYIQAAYKVFSVGLDFPSQPVEMDPYALGYWLGDGHTAGTRITTDDQEIRDYYVRFAALLGIQITTTNELTFDVTTGTNSGGPGRNPWRNFLNSHGLIGNKYIPDVYKMNSRENRLRLLAGIIDSDGSLGENVYDMIFKSERLADDVVFLVRSLGFFTYKRETIKVCTNAPDGPVAGIYYRFHICGSGLENIPVLLPRKKAHERRTKKNANVNGFDIAPVGKSEYRSFEVAEKGHLLLGDYTCIH